jgi:hypothetical protein
LELTVEPRREPREYFFTDLTGRLRVVPVADEKTTFHGIASLFDRIPGRCGFELNGDDLPIHTPVWSFRAHPFQPISVCRRPILLDIVTETGRDRQTAVLELSTSITARMAQEKLATAKKDVAQMPLLLYKSVFIAISPQYKDQALVKINPELALMKVRWVDTWTGGRH